MIVVDHFIKNAPGLRRRWVVLALLALLVIVFLAVGGWFLYHPPAEEPSSPELDVTPRSGDTSAPGSGPTEVSYAGRDGATVLELLKERHRVRLDSELALFGAIVLEIDSLAAGPSQFWIFYRDSLRGDRPPDECSTRTGEWIRWVLLERR